MLFFPVYTQGYSDPQQKGGYMGSFSVPVNTIIQVRSLVDDTWKTGSTNRWRKVIVKRQYWRNSHRN